MKDRKAYRKAYYEAHKKEIFAKKDAWRKANPDKYRAQVRRWNEKHRESEALRKRKWYEDNKEEILRHQKAYRAVNKDKCAARARRYYLKNKDKMNAYSKAYAKTRREANPEENRAYCRAYYQQHREEILAKAKAKRDAARGEGGDWLVLQAETDQTGNGWLWMGATLFSGSGSLNKAKAFLEHVIRDEWQTMIPNNDNELVPLADYPGAVGPGDSVKHSDTYYAHDRMEAWDGENSGQGYARKICIVKAGKKGERVC